MPDFPTGVITLVFTDIQGSSDLWEQHRGAFQPVLEEHNRLLRAAAALWHGVEVKTEGDAFFLVFGRASDAVRFAVEAQLSIACCRWDDLLVGLPALRVRMGLHTGETIFAAHPDGTADYFGPTVNRAARVGAAGHGGQVIVSDGTRALAQAELPPEITWLDVGRHRLKGVGEEQLWQLCHPDLPREFPALKTLDPQRHNLPLAPAPIIGRETEIERWLAVLRQPATRLLTLSGFGGFGKTRLALQLAELSVDDLADGVWWVDLEEARDSEDMLQRIANELRLHLQPHPTVREQVLNFHRDRELLLVLDNLEQIPDAAKPIDELLKTAPRVKCLATTRRPLELRHEQVVELKPLPVEAARALFIERARARVADYEVDEANAADLLELCRRLEGVPLAIELAASRIAGMTPREMLRRLDERFRLLQTRAHDLPPRQRALRGAIDWSYDLLTDDDKAVFGQVAVFAGGFTMPAAEAVCEGFDVFESIMELRRQSLLRAETTGDTQQTRYAMLESVHAYSLEKLEAAPDAGGTSDAATVRRRHADFFLRFANDCIARRRTPGEPAALRELDAELDNLRAALHAMRAAGEHELCARLALALHHPLHRRGLWAEAYQCLQGGCAALDELADVGNERKALQASLRLALAGLDYDMGNAAAAETNTKAALALLRELGDEAGQADGLNLLGLLATEAPRLDVAGNLFQKALAMRSAGEHHGRAIALHNLARIASRRGEKAEAQRLYLEALAERRAGGDAWGEAETLGDLGVLAMDAGDHPGALRYYHDSLNLRRALGDRQGIALMLYNLAEIAELEGDHQRAVTLFTHSERIFRELQSAYAGAANEALQLLAAKLDAATFISLRAVAESANWENIVQWSSI